MAFDCDRLTLITLIDQNCGDSTTVLGAQCAPWCLNELGFGSGPFEWRLGSGPVTLYTANFFRWTPLPAE